MSEQRDGSERKPTAPREDAFEAKEMRDGSPIVHRDKKTSRGMAALLMAPGAFTIGIAVFVAMVNSTSQKPLPAGALPFVVAAMILFGLGFFALGLMFAVLRLVVSEREVHVKYGLWGPSIALDAIRSCKVVDYHWTEYGGWGLRMGRDGSWAYVPGGKRVVEIRYADGAKEKRVLVGCEDPDETALQINRARRLRIADDSGTASTSEEQPLRVADQDALVAEAQRELDAETEAADAREREPERAKTDH